MKEWKKTSQTEDSSCCAQATTLADRPLLRKGTSPPHTHTHTLLHLVTLCSITPHCHHLQGTLTESNWQQRETGLTVKNIKEVETPSETERDVAGTGSRCEHDTTVPGTFTCIKRFRLDTSKQKKVRRQRSVIEMTGRGRGSFWMAGFWQTGELNAAS